MTVGPLLVLSGPSGSGKTTVISRLLTTSVWPLRLSVSATTRAPRPGEQDGVHYYFWTRDRFEQGVRAAAFLEWATVHGHCYGTLISEVDPYRQQGTGVLLDIDVQGAERVCQLRPDAVTVFLRTSTPEMFARRLRSRGTEDEDAIQKRLATAERELGRAGDYRYQVINDDLETAVGQLRAIVERHWPGE